MVGGKSSGESGLFGLRFVAVWVEQIEEQEALPGLFRLSRFAGVDQEDVDAVRILLTPVPAPESRVPSTLLAVVRGALQGSGRRACTCDLQAQVTPSVTLAWVA